LKARVTEVVEVIGAAAQGGGGGGAGPGGGGGGGAPAPFHHLPHSSQRHARALTLVQ